MRERNKGRDLIPPSPSSQPPHLQQDPCSTCGHGWLYRSIRASNALSRRPEKEKKRRVLILHPPAHVSHRCFDLIFKKGNSGLEKGKEASGSEETTELKCFTLFYLLLLSSSVLSRLIYPGGGDRGAFFGPGLGCRATLVVGG